MLVFLVMEARKEADSEEKAWVGPGLDGIRDRRSQQVALVRTREKTCGELQLERHSELLRPQLDR